MLIFRIIYVCCLSMSVLLYFSKMFCNFCVDGCIVYSGYFIYWLFKICYEFI